MQKFFKPLNLKKGQIDLRSIGAQEQHEKAIARMHEQDLSLLIEDERQANVPPLPQPKSFVAEKLTAEKAYRIVKGMIIREALALRP